MLQPFVRETLAVHCLPENLLIPARSTKCLRRRHRKRCAPNHAKGLLALATAQNCDAWRVQSIPTPSGPLQQDYAHSCRASLPSVAPRLTHSYHSAPLLVRSLPPCPLCRRRSLRDATRIAPNGTDSRRPAYRSLPEEILRLPSARSEHHASRIVAQTRNHPKKRDSLPKRSRLQSLAPRRSVPAPVSNPVPQSELQRTACPSGGNSATDPSLLNTGPGVD